LRGDLDYLIVDLPPGTGDIQISLMQKFPISASLIVTTMQNLAFADVLRAKNMLNKMNIPILGCIINMEYFICEKCKTKHKIFGSLEEDSTFDSLNLNILAYIPIDLSIGEAVNCGKLSNIQKNIGLYNKLLNLTYKCIIQIVNEAERTQNILDNQLPVI
jgi:ATP-binding protein involved in chromosome partitioning